MDDGWRLLEREGAFALRVPPDAEHRVEEDGALTVVQLKTKPATQVLIGLMPLVGPGQKPTNNRAKLEEKVTLFCRRTAGMGEGSVETRFDPATHLLLSQGIVRSQNGRWWLVRGYCAPAGEQYWLLHWNGAEADLRSTALPLFDSFSPSF
jgi:hypothetical protein